MNRQTEFLMGLSGNVVLSLARDRVPLNVAEKLLELNVVYDYYGDQTHYRLSRYGRELVANVVMARGLVGQRPRVVTDDERQERKVHAIAAKKNQRIEWLAERAEVRRLAVIEEAKVMARMMTRGLSEVECVSCGCDIEYKVLRIFDRRKKYECAVCGLRVRPKRVPRENGAAGRLPVISINGGLGAIVCWDCVEYCSSCWTKKTYKYIMKVYGVDLRD